MFNFREKRIFERILYSKATLGALSIFLFFVMSAVWGVYEKYHEAKQNKDVALAEFEMLDERVRAREADVALLKTDRGIEKKIREEFGFAKEGEGVILIVPEAAREDVLPMRREDFLGGLWEGIRKIF